MSPTVKKAVMTSRERLSRLFSNQEIDHTPIWLLSPFHPVSYYADIYQIPQYRPLVELIDAHCDIFDRFNYDLGFAYSQNPDVQMDKISTREGAEQVTEIRVRYRDKVWKSRTAFGGRNPGIQKWAETADDLIDILNIPYVPLRPDLSGYQKMKDELGNRGLMMPAVGDPLNALNKLMTLENFSYLTIENESVMYEFLDEMYRRVCDLYRYLLQNDVGDVFFIVGAEFAGPPIVSPEKFNALCVRYVKGIVDLIRSYGKWSIVHYHGQLKHVLPGMREIGADGLHTVEAPPVGNCTLAEAREALGNQILIGNIQYDDLSRSEPEQIVEQTRKAIREGGGTGRFILSPTAGPYESTLSEKLLKNYQTMVLTGVECGGQGYRIG